MDKKNKEFRLLVAAGGTGGHLFPAMAVVEELEKLLGNNFKPFFAGTKHRIEGRIIPQKGYDFMAMDVHGFTKLLSLNTLTLPFKIYKTIHQTRNYIKDNNIDAVLCTGAYISYAPGIAAYKENKPLFLMESNVNPGKAINQLATKATKIFTSFKESKSYFADTLENKLFYSGNPVRNAILNSIDKIEAKKKLGFNPENRLVFIFGGSLGANAINFAVENNLQKLEKLPFSFLWQTGSNYKFTKKLPSNFQITEFIDDMETAYSAADLVVSRSGATTVAELTVCGMPSILVPLPSASNNEQKHNAVIMEKNHCSQMIPNDELNAKLFPSILDILQNPEKLELMSKNAKKMAKPNAGNLVANEIIKYMKI